MIRNLNIRETQQFSEAMLRGPCVGCQDALVLEEERTSLTGRLVGDPFLAPISEAGGSPPPRRARPSPCCGSACFRVLTRCLSGWIGSALDLHLSDVSLAPLDKELDEQDSSDLGPTGKSTGTWSSCQGGWGSWAFQEFLSGSRVGGVPSPPRLRFLQPGQGQSLTSLVYLHLSKGAPAEMEWV